MKRQAVMRALRCAATAGILVTGLAAHAGQPPAQGESRQPGQAAPQQAPMKKVTDEQLQQFIDAASEVQNVQASYAQQMQNVDDQQQAQSLRQEAQKEMVGVVEESGLTVQEFNQIAQRLQADPELAERLDKIRGS